MIFIMEYIPSDLTSTFVYIKNRFGTSAFMKTGRVSALVSDLAPGLKSDRAMLRNRCKEESYKSKEPIKRGRF